MDLIIKNIFLKIYILLLLCLTLNLFASSPTKLKWEQIDRDECIDVFRKVVRNSNLVAFKGIGEIDAPLGKVLWVLLDYKHRTDWVDRLKTTIILEKDNNPFEYVAYQEFKLPWPLSNRDYVYQGKAEKVGNNIVLNMHSVKRDCAPKTVGVRAELHHSSYTMEPINNKKTRLIVEIYSDPKGSLPKWFVNLIQKNWPLKTLKGIRKQVKKTFVKYSPLPISNSGWSATFDYDLN